jgi:hypothetical protein
MFEWESMSGEDPQGALIAFANKTGISKDDLLEAFGLR